MRAQDYLSAILAGFLLILLWYVQFALGFADWAGTMVTIFIYPLITAICPVLLLKHRRARYVLVKMGVFLTSAVCFIALFRYCNLHYAIINMFIPGYGGITAGGGFAIVFEGIFYFGINGAAIFCLFCFCILRADTGRAENKQGE